MNTLEYKGYCGSIEYSEEDKCLHGEILGLSENICITYEGSAVEELITDFKDAVDCHLDFCERRGTEPEKPPLPVYKTTDELRFCGNETYSASDRYKFAKSNKP